jgi:hypothetical protein
MILNGSAHVLFEFEKNNKQSLKIDPGTQKRRGMLNVFIECDMMCYGTLENNIDQGRRPWSILLFSAP